MSRWQDRYLIIAGSADGTDVSRLYEWSGAFDSPRWLRGVDFTDLNPEAIASLPDEYGSELLVLSDDGSVICDGVECKRLKDPARRRFRFVDLQTPVAR
jgi:hypothetical protein